MQEKIAIDIVLLLPENISNICKELNRSLEIEDYVSFENGYYPHITLGMGSLLVESIDSFKSELGSLLEKSNMPEVTLTSLGSGKYCHFNLYVSEELQTLHNAVFDLITKHSAGVVTKENFFELSESSSIIDWVNNFKINSAYENYHPHITLGKGVTDTQLEFPITFKPISVGLFHLGKHGTCKKLLNSFELK
ncbi:MAG: hypothetical protein KBD55_00800 [Candidatus Pacebacteria bacterium]|nr:hypothetical protein [Candidatus Paceibacterota bacterium]